MPPRAFERPATIALPGEAGARGDALEGLHVPVSGEPVGGAVIAPPHPQYGGSMDSPVATEIAHACERSGWESLRFNWRGVGASAGAVSGDFDVADEDYRAALDFLDETVDTPIAACGYSFGAAAAVRAGVGRPRVQRILLVAPPPSMLDVDALRAFSGRLLIAVGERDTLADAAELESIAGGIEGARFAAIPEADHFFMTGLTELRRVATDWLGSR